MNTRMQNLNLG